MGLRDDLDRYSEVGEENRLDLSDFIKQGDLGQSHPDKIKIPIKIIDLPEFVYDKLDMGGVGEVEEGEPEIGDELGMKPMDGEGDDGAGSGEGNHDYYEMDPEEFASELEQEFDLELEPKGKQVLEEKEGDLTDIVRSGPMSTLHFKKMFKEGMKRELAINFNPDLLREILKVKDMGPEEVFHWARVEQNLNVSREWLEEAYREIENDERDRWGSIEEAMEFVDDTYGSLNPEIDIRKLKFRKEDERYRYPEIEKKKESKVVVVNIRDVSGSMGEDKRDLVERTFTPLDWYLQGKYEEAEFVYIAHDVDAWRINRDDFFGIQSGGGTRISSAYELTRDILSDKYPWSQWNRYVFAAGDGENSSNDTKKNVIPLMEDIEANLHSYIETQPGGDSVSASHRTELIDHFGESSDVVLSMIQSREDVMDAIYSVLAVASGNKEVVA